MPTASASHAPKNAAFTAKIRSHMLLAWVYQADMRKYFRNITFVFARKANHFYVLHIAKRKNGSYLSSPPKQNRRNAAPILLWRRGQDSNLRALASKLISSQPRYDHFDTSPYAPLSMRSLIKITYLVRKIKRFYLTCQISFAYCSMARSEENLPALAILSMLLV